MAERQGDTALCVVGHRMVAVASMFLGRLVPARSHNERVLQLSATLREPPPLILTTIPHVASLAFLSLILLFQGYPERAQARHREALAEARTLAHPFSWAFALHLGCIFRQFRREHRAAGELADALVALAAERGFAHLLGAGMIIQGWVIAEGGDRGAGLARMREGLAAKRSTGAEIKVPYNLALIAEAEGKAGGSTEEGLRLLVDALALVERTGERWFEAELYRLKGELLLSLSKADEAEACFHQALEVARQQAAPMWELRAATSLARLGRDQGKRGEARDLLAPVYGWFTEGFDTLDLQEAKALLEALR